jgi:UDP-GlcNAc3NAcA epimerase
MIRIASIVGARPQFIKAAIVSSHLRAHPGIEEKLIHTGQHYSQTMSDVFFDELEIPKPDLNLGVGQATPATQIGTILIKLDPVLQSESFDWVLVYGDTSSTLAGALAAVKAGVPLAHVEAGLRSFNRQMPEEINRVISDHLADLLFTPTETADANLQKEGIPAERIYRAGDVMYDSVLYYREKAGTHSGILKTLGLSPKAYALGTVHRAENTDDPQKLKVILQGMAQASKEIEIILPLHPRTREAMNKFHFGNDLPSALRLIDPVSYLDMLQLEANAKMIVTDSGGVQKEAFFLGVPSVILRAETEWVELLAEGWSRLAPPSNPEQISKAIQSALSTPTPGSTNTSLYGDGHAAEKIRVALMKDA